MLKSLLVSYPDSWVSWYKDCVWWLPYGNKLMYNFVKHDDSASVGQFNVISISDTLLVLWYLLDTENFVFGPSQFWNQNLLCEGPKLYNRVLKLWSDECLVCLTFDVLVCFPFICSNIPVAPAFWNIYIVSLSYTIIQSLWFLCITISFIEAWC